MTLGKSHFAIATLCAGLFCNAVQAQDNGMVVGGELRVENPSGGLLHEEDFDPAPLFGVTYTARF